MARLEGLVAAVSRGHDSVARAIGDAYRREGAEAVLDDSDAGDARRATEAVVDAAVERCGRLDLLVLRTPPPDRPKSHIADMADKEWIGAIDATLNHAVWGIRRALQHMIPHGQGRILVVSSVAAKLAVPGGAAGAATEHAVTGLVKSVAHEVGTLGIKVNALLRGVLKDEHADADGETAACLERSTIKRSNTVEEVAEAAVLLASPSLSSLTGCLFPVDGRTMPY
jgi:3-hydroxybutyrate dehydrogenase